MTFASVYPMYVERVEKKGRTKEELHEVIEWLTGFDTRKLRELIEDPLTRKVRYLDKLVDELAKGRKMEKVLRVPSVDSDAPQPSRDQPRRAPSSATR
jgi:hypothetical protein